MKGFRAGVITLGCVFALFCLTASADESSANKTNDATVDQASVVKLPEAKPATTAPPQAVIKVNDNVMFRFGVLVQPQVDMQETATGTDGYAQNVMLRRVRLMMGGQVTKNVFFFFDTEASRDGNATTAGAKNWTTSFQVLDAVAEYRYSKPLNIWAGLIYLPTSREALKSSASVFMLDQNLYAYTATTALMGTAGRDTGVMARGYFDNDKIEYRAGIFSGFREAGLRNSMRRIARIQYNFLDTEPYTLPSYPGSYFGAKKIVAIGAAYDAQNDYRGYTSDLFIDIPVKFGSFQSTVTWQQLDGAKTVLALPKSDTFAIDAGAYAKSVKIGPWVRYEERNYSDAANKSKNEKHEIAGINWYPSLNNFNVKVGYGVLKPAVGRNVKDVTVQMQFYFY
ncbi:MAG TPA: porin [Thermoanaerobaculia bacterium]